MKAENFESYHYNYIFQRTDKDVTKKELSQFEQIEGAFIPKQTNILYPRNEQPDGVSKKFQVANLPKQKRRIFTAANASGVQLRSLGQLRPKTVEETLETKLKQLQDIQSKKQKQLQQFKQEINLNKLQFGFLNYERLQEFPLITTKEELIESKEMKNKVECDIFEAMKIKPQIQLQLMSNDSRFPFQKNQQIQDKENNLQEASKLKKDMIIAKSMESQSDQRARTQQLIMQQSMLINIKSSHKQNQSLFHMSNQFKHLRLFYQFQKSSPSYSLLEELNIKQIPELSVDQVCQWMDYPLPNYQDQKLEFPYLIINSKTAIPYYVITSDQVSEDSPSEVYLIAIDIFDSMIEYFELFENLKQKCVNTKFIFFHVPGQSYTIFSQNLNYDNFTIANIIDKLLYEINEKVIKLDECTMNMIGIGFGGFFLQTFLIFQDITQQICSKILLINSFAELDQTLQSTLTKSIEVFEGCPSLIKELPFNYYQIIVNSQELSPEELEIKMSKNPISIVGRVSIIKGLLNSYEIKDKFESMPICLEIFHSLKNCLININHVDQLLKYIPSNQISNLNAVLAKNKNPTLIRKSNYVEGGHDMLDENPGKLFEIINGFVFDLENFDNVEMEKVWEMNLGNQREERLQISSNQNEDNNQNENSQFGSQE